MEVTLFHSLRDASFSWPLAADVIYVRGNLADVDSYAVDTVELLVLATSLTDASVPESGAGFFYLVNSFYPTIKSDNQTYIILTGIVDSSV